MLSPVTDSSLSSTFVQPPGAPQHVCIQLMPIQLTRHNYLLWKSLFIPILKTYDMLNLAEGIEQCPSQFLTSTSDGEDKKEDPAYTNWIKRDQMFLTWINASLSARLLRYTRECTSGRALWLHLENLLAKNAACHVLGLKARLQNLDKRRYCRMKDYLDSAKQIADELEAAGSPVEDCELVSSILEGLLLQPKHYDDLVASIRTRSKPVTLQELHGLLLGHIIHCSKETKKFAILCSFLLMIVLVSSLFLLYKLLHR
ncbi:hypothetical protein M0R45_023945 [Rubus argutus]|uniref:Retrotransposon Copia-like N-terminal domain-containing protein n=1 Tax=Rubus argutus TaxID=59490 RepID=A0AAW1WTS6_RUBAR